MSALYYTGIENVVICGIEGHVCVKSTVYELLKRGINTHVVVDAVSSRSMVDRYVVVVLYSSLILSFYPGGM